MKRLLISLTLLASFNISAQAQKKNSKPSRLSNVQIANDGLTVMYGNAMIEKLQEEGSFETYMQIANAGKRFQFRSLAYTGDQVGFRIRASKFGLHLGYILDQWKANSVIMAFGSNESYLGASNLDTFEKELESYIELIKLRHGNSHYVLVSPIAAEKVSSIQGIDNSKRNADIKLYSDAIAKAAAKHKIKFIDLYTPTAKLFENSDKVYTLDGQHLNNKGSQEVGKLLASAMLNADKVNSISTNSVGFNSTRKLVQRKAIEVAQSYHPSNGISYYGLRSRDYEYNAEIPHHLKLANILDQAIWKQSKSQEIALATPNLPVMKIKGHQSKPKNGLGIIKSSKEDLADFTVADGFTINCFASSEDHPELINPLQMNFDTKGRLWVTCFASYPHPLPGLVSNDSILIFEDTDGDGKADKKTVFADQLNLPDGFVFYKKGIIASVSKKLIYLEDTDGDNIADIREEVLRGFDNSDTHHSGYLSRSPQGHIILSEALFHRGQFETLGGVLHTKDTSIMSFDMDTRKLVVERQTEAPNPWKVTYNQWGESIQFYGGGQIIDADIHNIATPMGSSAMMELGMPFRYDKGCTATFVDSPHFPAGWQNGILTGHLLSKNEINYTPLQYKDGAFKADGKKKILVKSKNKVFRPSDISFGLDGALYITDFYYPIIGHAQHSNRDKNRDYANGRIWRISANKAPLVKKTQLEGKSVEALIQELKNPFLKARQVTRLALENQPTAEVKAALAKAAKSHKKHDVFALELLWLMEQHKDFSDTSLLKSLLTSSKIEVQRAAVRSLRWWSDALGSELPTIVANLSESSDARLKIGLVSVLSHLQIKDSKWSAVIANIKSEENTNLSYVKQMATWIERPGLAAEFPIVNINQDAYIKKSAWLPTDKPLYGVIYFSSEQDGEIIIGHEDNPFLNITVNDTPVLIAGGGPHSKASQNNVKVKKGINKLEYSVLKSTAYRKKVNDKFHMYLATKTGASPSWTTLAPNAKQHKRWMAKYEKQQSANWQVYALETFKQNCANCHAIESKAVGPALKGLLGKKQSITTKDGTKKNIVIDTDYIRRSIVDPTAEYPQGYQPIMPKMPLSDKEIDALVRWIKELK